MTSWQKIPHSGKGKPPPHWLEIRPGKFRTSYRVRSSKDGIERVLKGEFQKWQDAEKAGEELIYKKRFGERPKPKSLVTCESLCDEIVELKKTKSKGTYEQAEVFFRVHIKPFLEVTCPYVADLNATVWQKYRNEFRLKHPGRPLFNHWKFFSQLFKVANDKGFIPKTKLDYSQTKDDSRASGQVIPDSHLRAFLEHANRNWRDRVMLQVLTGQRPGVIRRLQKSFVDFKRAVVSIPKAESKNRRTYQFVIPTAALEILNSRLENDSPYFFPSELDKKQPMDKHLTGWHNAWKRAGIKKGYTPHDVRHTFLTDKVNASGTNLAVLCYSCDLSLDELMRTYVHFKVEDTKALADASELRVATLIGGDK